MEGVELFDVFTGKELAIGTRSLAFRVAFRHPDRTLSDGEAISLQEGVLAGLSKEYGAHLRTGLGSSAVPSPAPVYSRQAERRKRLMKIGPTQKSHRPSQQVALVALVCTLLSFLSGACTSGFWRIKKQLLNFDANFKISGLSELVIEFKNPVMRVKDVRFLNWGGPDFAFWGRRGSPAL